MYLTRLYKLQEGEGGGVYRCANLNVSQARPPAGICIPPRIHRAATSSEDLDSGVALPTPRGFIHKYIYQPSYLLIWPIQTQSPSFFLFLVFNIQ
jgi:hypothetical protein